MGWRGANLLKHYTFIFYSSSNILPSSSHPTSSQSIELNLSVLCARFRSRVGVGCRHVGSLWCFIEHLGHVCSNTCLYLCKYLSIYSSSLSNQGSFLNRVNYCNNPQSLLGKFRKCVRTGWGFGALLWILVVSSMSHSNPCDGKKVMYFVSPLSCTQFDLFSSSRQRNIEKVVLSICHTFKLQLKPGPPNPLH